MMQKTPYENLHLIPSVIAEVVCREEYHGRESNRPPHEIAETEQLRKLMTEEQIQNFIKHCDERCRNAYQNGTNWFIKCVNARGNRGRDQMYAWTKHWLAGHLNRLNKLSLIKKEV